MFSERNYQMSCNCFKGCGNQCCSDYEELCTGTNISSPIIPKGKLQQNSTFNAWYKYQALIFYLDLKMSEINLKEQIEKWSWKREDFITLFSHPEWGDPRKGTHILSNDSYWTVRKLLLIFIMAFIFICCLMVDVMLSYFLKQESVPHNQQSGKCFTYDPPFDSNAGWWFGLR